MLAKSSLFCQISNASLRCPARSGKTGDVLQEFHRGRQGQQGILQSFVPAQVSQRHHMVSCPLLRKTTKIHLKKTRNISSWIHSPVQLTSANVICPCLLFYQFILLFSASAPSKPTAATSCASTSATSFGSSRRRRRATATTTTSRSGTANTGTRP